MQSAALRGHADKRTKETRHSSCDFLFVSVLYGKRQAFELSVEDQITAKELKDSM